MNEAEVEAAAFDWFRSLGYALRTGSDVDDAGERAKLSDILLAKRARAAVRKFNADLPEATTDAVVALLARPPHPAPIENNRWFHGMLAGGVEVEYKDKKTGETRGGRAKLIDFDTPANNDFLVVRQLTIQGENNRTIRPDLLVFVNGLPLVALELKDPANTAADLNMAIDQFGRYKQIAPDLFVPNLLLAVSDGLLTRVGSITS